MSDGPLCIMQIAPYHIPLRIRNPKPLYVGVLASVVSGEVGDGELCIQQPSTPSYATRTVRIL